MKPVYLKQKPILDVSLKNKMFMLLKKKIQNNFSFENPQILIYKTLDTLTNIIFATAYV